MPAVDYEYDYYSRGRKVNKAASVQRATKKVDSSVSSTSNIKQTGTRQSTKDQVRKAMNENPKQQTTKRKASQASTKTTTRRTVKTNYNLDIPEVKNGKKVNNVATSKVVTKTNKSNNYAKPAEMKLKKPEPSAAQKKKAREKAVTKVKNVLYLITGFAIAFLICYRYSLIDEKFNQLEKTKKELLTAQTVNEQIQADIDSQTDLSYIENFAKYQLGMQKPSNSQIVYVNVEKEDRILTPITIEEDTDSKTWLDQLYEEIMKFFND